MSDKDKDSKKKAKKEPSDQPTALIAPSDYEHIYKGNEADKEDASSKNSKKSKAPAKAKESQSKAKEKETEAKKVPSDQPTTLIAPSDYEHIYNDPDLPKKGKASGKAKAPAKKAPSDTPTALIAPSDFEHIYRDEDVEKEQRAAAKAKKVSMAKATAKRERTPSERKRGTEREKTSNARKRQQNAGSAEVLPDDIQDKVDRFIDKQPQSYTINKDKDEDD